MTSPCVNLHGPLHGIRVLDLTAVLLGPMATQVLADFGADVVKVEGPQGDVMRANGVSMHPGMGSLHMALNRNKRSLVLDLKLAGDTLKLSELIKTADVFIHNMRVAAIERLGFGYEEVKALNPRIVYCAATGFGQAGPDRDKPAFDDIIQAACGLASLASLHRDTPEYVPSLIADKTTGLMVANAVMAALVCRERHGFGQYIEVPMLETMTAFTLLEHMGGLTFPDSSAKAGYARLLEGGRRPLRTRDGWLCVLPYTESHWKTLFEAVGGDVLRDRFRLDDRKQLIESLKSLYEQLDEILPMRSTDEWLALCTELDIPASRIYTLDELPTHPHLQAVGLFQSSTHPSEGALLELRPTTLFQATPISLRRPAPRLGEHTAEVLAEAGLC